MKVNTYFLSIITLCIITFLPVILLAQPGGPGGPPTPAPFDGGLSLILAAGAGYAAKKKYDQRKKQKLEQKETES